MRNNREDAVDFLESALTIFRDSGRPIPSSVVDACIASEDLEMQGALHYFLEKEEFLSRITPSIPEHRILDFFLNYWSKCLIQDPDGEWADSRYQACRDCMGRFLNYWQDRSKRELELLRIKTWFAECFISGAPEIKDALVMGALEHMFEDPGVRAFFSDWAVDRDLRVAFSSAEEWRLRKPA